MATVDIDSAVEFFQGFIAKEREAEVALANERDDAVFEALVDELNTFYTGDIATTIYREPEADEASFSFYQRKLQGRKTPILFKVARYAGPRGAALYRAYASSNLEADDTYFTTYWAKVKRGKLKIVAQYNRCTECQGTGKVNGRTCPECKGRGWNWRGGEHIDDPGKPEEVRKLQPPADPQDLADYEAE